MKCLRMKTTVPKELSLQIYSNQFENCTKVMHDDPIARVNPGLSVALMTVPNRSLIKKNSLAGKRTRRQRPESDVRATER